MPQQDYQITNPEFENYAETHSTPESELLHRLYRETNLKTMYPRMMSGQLQGNFLRMVSRMMRPDRILEIGTFTGYSAINLAMGLNGNGKLHTIDSNAESVEIARKYFREAGLEDRIVAHVGNALEILNTINDTFDLVFIDADKENYLNYYETIFERVRPGGVIMADNTLWGGKVVDADHADHETRGVIRFNNAVHADPRVEHVLLPVRDGIMMINKL